VRGITRIYSTVACLFLGAVLTAALFAAVAARLAPEWVEEAGGSLSRAIARLAGGTPPAGSEAAPAPAEPPPARPVSGAGEPAAAVLPAGFPDGGGGESPGVAAGRAARSTREAGAWRAVEGSIARLLEAAGDSGSERVDAAAAPRIAARLERLARDLETRAAAAVSLEPRVLARVLLEDESITDERAMEMLDTLRPAARAEVIDRLSRLSPRRAARLLDRALGGEAARYRRGPEGRGGEKG
jgi:hypothetical protein